VKEVEAAEAVGEVGEVDDKYMDWNPSSFVIY
jgi:hypothetical protein